MALQPQIVMGNGAFTVRRFMEIAAATTDVVVRVAKTEDAPLPPPADFDPRFGTQVNFPFYMNITRAVMFFGNVTDEAALNSAAIPQFFLAFFNKSGDFYLNMFGLQAPPYRLLDTYYQSPSGPIVCQGIEYETVPVGDEPRYFDIQLTRDPSVVDIQVTLDFVLPQSINW